MKHFFAWLLLGCLGGLTPAWAQAPPKTSPYDSAHFSWRKPVPRDRLRELQPDRPGITESPFTVDAGHVQVEMDALRLINGGTDNEDRTREWHAAYTMLKLGLSRRTDVQLELPLYSVAKQRPSSSDKWEEQHAGFGDVTLRVKHNFIGDDQLGRFAMAVIGYVQLPTGGPVGSGAAEYGVVLPVDVKLSDKLNVEAQVGSELRYDREQDRRYLNLLPSMALQYGLTSKLSMLAEVVGQWNTEQRRWQSSVNLAPIIKVNSNLQLDLGTHLALNRLSDREYFVGVVFRR